MKLINVNKSYNTSYGKLQILKNISVSFEKGKFYAIMGRSGSGKSTLVNILGLLDNFDDGDYYLNDINVKQLNDKTKSKIRGLNIGFVFQSFYLNKNLTAYENIILPTYINDKMDDTKRKNRALNIMKKLEIIDRREHKPSSLSGGEQQRVAIARALATEPKVLLCDEATSALDPNTTAGVLSLLKDINTRLGITIVVITHEMSVIQEICDRVAIIDGGLIAEEGGVEEIFRAPKTKIGQELVMHEGTNREAYTGKLPYSYRLVFKGGSENEPVLGQMMIELKNVVNILAANTRTIENQAFGQMLVQFPEEKEIRQKMIQYLTDRGVEVEEVEYV